VSAGPSGATLHSSDLHVALSRVARLAEGCQGQRKSSPRYHLAEGLGARVSGPFRVI
jgi:hypothetical protein